MSHIRRSDTAIGRTMVLACLAVVIAIIVSFLVPTPFIPAAHAAALVPSNDIIYSHFNDGPFSNIELYRVSSDGAEAPFSPLTHGAMDPQTSPDGKRIVFIQVSATGLNVATMSSDGSGSIHTLVSVGYGSNLQSPRWSPDGRSIAYIETFNQQDGSRATAIKLVSSDGLGIAATLLAGSNIFGPIDWSPDSRRIVFSGCFDGQTTYDSQLYIIGSDGTNLHQVDKINSSRDQLSPAWSPDGNTIYWSEAAGSRVISSATSTDQFATNDGVDRVIENNSLIGEDLQLSKNGRTLVFCNWYRQIATYSIGRGGQPVVWTERGESATKPTFANPIVSALTIEPPKPTDPILTRNITVNLTRVNVSSYEYGWSSSDSTPPNPPYQTTTDTHNGYGILDYRPTTPSSSWFLWARPVHTDGSNAPWSRPLRVRTPHAPFWIGLGDSYSSGHHQDTDNPLCPRLVDVGKSNLGRRLARACNRGRGPADLVLQDPIYSWVHTAANRLSRSENLPLAWSIQSINIAMSGASTTQILTKQAPPMQRLLQRYFDSWNIVSLTGGADDVGFSDALAGFYSQHLTSVKVPWNTTNVRDCPDASGVYSRAIATDYTVISNLKSIIDRAIAASSSTHIVEVGYGYIVDSLNPCSGNNGSASGSHAVVDLLNRSLAVLVNQQVCFVDLTANAGFGNNPVSDGYLQLTRLYGYPHPNANGQNRIATLAADLARTMS